MTRVVLDTNVIIAGLSSKNGASYQLLCSMPENLYKPLISVPLILEYEAILKMERKRIFLSDNEIEIVLNMFAATSQHIRLYYLWRPLLKDPGDDMVLELAVAGNADAIVTFNLNDFKEVKHLFNIDVITPAEFLKSPGGKILWNNIH